MPATEVLMYREGAHVPVLDWLEGLRPRARVACLRRLQVLREQGHELRRPVAAHLGRGIHELRLRSEGVHLRILYFFHGRSVVVLTHGFTKQRATVPLNEVWRALERRARFESDPSSHTFEPGA